VGSSLEREVPSSGFDPHAAQVQTVCVPAGLDGGVGVHSTITVVRHGVAQNIQLQSVELEVPSVQLGRKARSPETVVWVPVFIKPLAVVQKRKQLHHQKISPCGLPNGERVVSNTRPVTWAVYAALVHFELLQNLVEQTLPVELTRCHVGCFLGLEFTLDFTFMNRKISVHVFQDRLEFSQHQELD
jgi:hypothetical protein